MSEPETISNQSPGSQNARTNAPIQQVRVDVSGPLAILALVFSVSAFMMGIWSVFESQKSGRETRVLQQLSMDHDALLIREGLKQPGDESKGPAANLNYKPGRK